MWPNGQDPNSNPRSLTTSRKSQHFCSSVKWRFQWSLWIHKRIKCAKKSSKDPYKFKVLLLIFSSFSQWVFISNSSFPTKSGETLTKERKADGHLRALRKIQTVMFLLERWGLTVTAEVAQSPKQAPAAQEKSSPGEISEIWYLHQFLHVSTALIINEKGGGDGLLTVL